MVASYYRFSVPADLSAYYVTNVISENTISTNNFVSDVIICRNSSGCISSVKYYTPDKELSKEVFYNFDHISKINYYKNGILYSTEGYKDDNLTLKFVFQKNGYLAHQYEYEHNKKGQIISICKKKDKQEFLVVYKYDDFDRISCRKIYSNNEKFMEQFFIYDILDRIIEYKDNNQHIVVKKISKKNELLSYVITDKMNNNIEVENNITEQGYVDTNVCINGHSTVITDISYVDNVMLKKPYTNEDDIDLIIANLFGSSNINNTKRENVVNVNADKMIDKNIETRVLPISMRKRLLYSTSAFKVS